MSEIPDLDRIDRRILAHLQDDGRMSNLKLAEAVALSPTAVLARVQRLTRDGFIQGYQAILNPQLLGARMLVFVEVRASRQHLGRALESIGPDKQRRLAELAYCYLATHPPAPSDWRIDVIALAWRDDGWQVQHLRAAVGE